MTVPDKEAEATIAVIDDDPDRREALRGLLRSVGLGVELFGSVQEFLVAARLDRPGCLVLDVRLPGRSGLDLQEELAKADIHLPVTFIGGHADVPMSVRAMKVGAVEFLTKPVRDQDLLDAIQLAIAKDRARRVTACRSRCSTTAPTRARNWHGKRWRRLNRATGTRTLVRDPA